MLVRGENMIVTYEMLKESLTDYKAKDIKIKRMSDNKEIIKVITVPKKLVNIVVK